MITKALRQELIKTISELPEDKIEQVLTFARKLVQVKPEPLLDVKKKFWELKGAGNSGLKDVAINKHKYLEEAYKRDAQS